MRFNQFAALHLPQALNLHSNNAPVVRAICLAIRNCVARSPDLSTAFLGDDSSDPFHLEAELRLLLDREDCSDEAKAALRDLGLPVHLREAWIDAERSRLNSLAAGDFNSFAGI
ncbi:unnamed protein product [Protopolystoma xenopodis]|uniref:Ataxin-10 domain-containing protein n=1 Tax=Protopolystoma xenopodis TaxID=117903 RepID=A0A3S5CBP7_9PLAT|nr:unnamed protein product [Protopolystoma xenopodis]